MQSSARALTERLISLVPEPPRWIATLPSDARSFSCVSQKASGAFLANSIQCGPRIVSSVQRWHPAGVGVMIQA